MKAEKAKNAVINTSQVDSDLISDDGSSVATASEFSSAGSGNSGVPSTVEEAEREGEELFVRAFTYARHGSTGKLKKALDSGCPVDIRDKHGNTPLLAAAQNGHKKAIKELLRRGANMMAANHRGNTCLHYCFAFGFDELGHYLIRLGADDTVTNMFGLTCHEGIGQ
mmetsp:Transcript_7449/g.19242  ORF Transcript_7449/g.19242 Transcript_7449/m.19242 type:complete len:167 (-) Transcript_7449:460-960(-)